MDLVDIDQVLDNLELKAAEELNEVAASRGAQNVSVRNFVGVSQVFNHLDDYARNVEALGTARPKYDIERPLPKKTENEALNAATPAVSKPSTSYDTATVDDDEDDEASNDINKFTEEKTAKQNYSGRNESISFDDEVSGSDSLTTSSSSTFSSGPSAGAASTTDERLTPLTPSSFDTRDTQLMQQQREEHSAKAEAPKSNVEGSIDTAPARSLEDSMEVQGKTTLEDLATGLSSISISSSANSQSILPCETTTVSSALHKVLNELSDQSSISNFNQHADDFKLEDVNRSKSIATVSSLSAFDYRKTTDEIDKKIAAANEAPLQMNDAMAALKVVDAAPAYQQQQKSNQQQPITFSSTMDEISDTELDSMLQEMDIDADAVDEDQQQVEQNHLDMQNKTDRRVVEVFKIDATTRTDKEFEEANQHEMSADDEQAENQTTDSMNADSFSQASTVEFSEIRAQNTAPQIDDVGEQFNNSFSSSESSLDGGVEREAVIDEGEQAAATDIEDSEAQAQRPQRPTTLDLPAATAAKATKPNLYTNAGQTPPGNTKDAAEIQPVAQANATNDEATVNNENNEIAEATGYSDPNENLGRVPPIWVPDNMATGCMQCQTKFTMIKRRHHCRACGKVLCSVCCSQKFKLEFLTEPESRVCVQCYLILAQRQQRASSSSNNVAATASSDVNQPTENVVPSAANSTTTTEATIAVANGTTNPVRSPNPNNPMEYCSTIPPHRQVSADASSLPPPTVIVPVGVLKKDGSHSSNSSNSSSKQTRKRKSVMFSDGIAPGSDLAGMEQHQWGEAKHARRGAAAQQGGGRGGKPSTPVKSESHSDATTLGMVAQLFRGSIPPVAAAATVNAAQAASNHVKSQTSVATSSSPSKSTKRPDANLSSRARRLPPSGCDDVGCFIPSGTKALPPLFIAKDENGCEFDYKEVSNDFELLERLQNETLKFAVTRNFFVLVKILNLKCCLNRTVINFTTNGMHHVGNDEIIILLEIELPKSKELLNEPPLPEDIFVHLHEIYREAELGSPICELAYTSPRQERFLGSQDYGGFIFIRPTFQCLQDVILPENPFLIAILIHRTEVPWAKVFPLRLMLRLGAQYRYYPCPHVSMRQRESVYAEIAQTIINFLADFRNYSYTLPNIRGMFIHMEDRQTTVLIPRNRQEDIVKAMNDSSDHILAFGGNFSKAADGHLVCMQNTSDDRTELYSYSTQAINIQGQPRKITGASFFVLNESLKTTSGLLAKCSIVEDGLMVQILPTKMAEVRTALSTQKDIDILCGPVNAEEKDREIVSIKWVENDKDFNVGVKSPIDDKPLEGISSMRVHANFNYANTNYSIRLTEIFILKYDEWYNTQPSFTATSADITRISEQVARSTSLALIPFLDLLAASGNNKLSLRATLHQDNVCYEAGARGTKLPPLYMNALDNHLIPTLHNESAGIEDTIILELFFYILSV